MPTRTITTTLWGRCLPIPRCGSKRSKASWSKRAWSIPPRSTRRSSSFESRVGPHHGARVVARAWTDAGFRERLLADGTRAIGEMDLLGPQGQHVVVVANTPAVHNLVVCTLCSCYPWPLLGLPPRWYKSAPYRSRAVIDPRGVLREFGVELGPGVEVRVWDSTSEVRYLVLPERPPGTERTERGRACGAGHPRRHGWRRA